MIKNGLILLLAVAVVLLCARVVSLENQRYAATLGMCPSKVLPNAQDPTCLASAETRASWVWHLFYALKD